MMKSMLVQPHEIDLESDGFQVQLNRLLCAIRLSREHVNNLHILFMDLETVLKKKWPVTGLGIKGSDADCYVKIPHCDPVQTTRDAAKLIKYHRSLFANVMCIAWARVPIVKFHHKLTDMSCDVNFKSENGVHNSELLAFLHNLDPRLLRIAVIIKYWAEVYCLIGVNCLPKYGLNLMIIFYFQQMKILPSIEYMQRSAEPVYVNGWNSGYSTNIYPKIDDNSTDFDLLGGFFKFYNGFDFSKNIISTYVGGAISKELFHNVETVPDIFKQYKDFCNEGVYLRTSSDICVQDIFEHTQNCSFTVRGRIFENIKMQLSHAANCYQVASMDSSMFLYNLLTNGPQIITKKMMLRNKRMMHHKMKLKRLQHLA